MRITVNGRSGATVSARDRGLQYGDGVFETMRVRRREIRLLELHLDRLFRGLKVLKIHGPERGALRAELQAMARKRREGVLKLIVSRGPGTRGYRPTGEESSTRIAMLEPWAGAREAAALPVRVRMCTTRLAEQPRLAGLKTLNRLDSVLARSEWRGSRVWEGLMQDTDGRIVCGTMSNLYVRRGSNVFTPPLDRCGVAGVMRRWILKVAHDAELKVSERRLDWADLESAEEVFLSNAVAGIKSVSSIEWRGRAPLRFEHFEAAARLRAELERL